MEEDKVIGFNRFEEALKVLRSMFQDKSWFRDVGLDPYRRIVVYSTDVTSEVMSLIPENFAGIQVLCHYDSSRNVDLNKFVNKVCLSKQTEPFEMVIHTDIKASDMLEELEEPVSLVELEAELDCLEKVCGPHILQEIFFEIHDGKNSVTNLSARYPEVRGGMEKLYNEYGFDIIYENLEG